MSEIVELTKIDFVSVFIAVFAILIGVKAIVSLFEWVVSKLGLETKWMRQKREEHELLLQTFKGLVELQKKYEDDTGISDEHDQKLEASFTKFMEEVRELISNTQEEVKKFYKNREHDREQSREIQKQLTDSISSIVKRNEVKDQQMDSLTAAQREVLADKINEKYKHYLQINGIPEDEVDEFVNLHKAYKGIGGNHSGDAKFEYCMNHLQIIPVESKLKLDNPDNK